MGLDVSITRRHLSLIVRVRASWWMMGFGQTGRGTFGLDEGGESRRAHSHIVGSQLVTAEARGWATLCGSMELMRGCTVQGRTLHH